MSQQSRIEAIPSPNNRSYIKAFIRHKSLSGLSNITISNYVGVILQFLKLYNNDLKEVTRDDVEEYVYQCKQKEKPSSIQSTIISLRVFFSDLLGKEKSNELLGGMRVKVPLVKVHDNQLLSDDEIKRMIDACYTDRDRALVTLLYSSGCRCGEILGLKIKDVSFSQYGASIHVNGKTGERDVDLFVGVPELKAWYNTHPLRDKPDAPFWVKKSKEELHKQGLEFLLRRLAKRAGIPEGKKFNPHAFRHKRATDCAQFMTIADMKEMFGWTAGSNMPTVYVHSSRKRVAEKLMKQAGIKVPEQQMPIQMIKQCPKCGCLNAATSTLCSNCSSLLNEKSANVAKDIKKYMDEHMLDILEADKNRKDHKKDPNQHA